MTGALLGPKNLGRQCWPETGHGPGTEEAAHCLLEFLLGSLEPNGQGLYLPLRPKDFTVVVDHDPVPLKEGGIGESQFVQAAGVPPW